MVDKDILQRKLSFIDLKLRNLETLKRMNRQDFLKSFQAIDSAKYNLQVCIEALIDISNHVVARERWGIPGTSAETVKLLIEHGVLDKEKELSLVQMVKFRNRIAHLYQEVDDSEIYRILQENLKDIKDFIQAVISRFF
ncbi:type VII toxin-antitoxin system HepT family RNase toxin [Desulfosporosinus sp. SB140]|uniref:type VII toxin-antitoxin system HepT family RNase toxin n=1 Tax=Desulfosporosinus paludis TaxID=3115649 RepID=UPI0038908A45